MAHDLINHAYIMELPWNPYMMGFRRWSSAWRVVHPELARKFCAFFPHTLSNTSLPFGWSWVVSFITGQSQQWFSWILWTLMANCQTWREARENPLNLLPVWSEVQMETRDLQLAFEVGRSGGTETLTLWELCWLWVISVRVQLNCETLRWCLEKSENWLLGVRKKVIHLLSEVLWVETLSDLANEKDICTEKCRQWYKNSDVYTPNEYH